MSVASAFAPTLIIPSSNRAQSASVTVPYPSEFAALYKAVPWKVDFPDFLK